MLLRFNGKTVDDLREDSAGNGKCGMKRVLLLEPYYGGSHRYFLEGLQRHVPARYTLLSLPARKWKMRMQLSAPWLVERVKSLPPGERFFETVLCSSYVDAAVLRALLTRVPGWNNETRFCLYFHENQIVYPQRHDASAHQFAAINFHSALAADTIAFNSAYNARTFLEGCSQYLKSAASELALPGLIDELCRKSRVLHPGIDFPEREQRPLPTVGPGPVIVWNHRWEHDKNPERFFRALMELSRRGLDFRLIVAGQSFRSIPACFDRIRSHFASRLLHFGYAPSHRDYLALLARGDLVVSTAMHEFYGIAVIEAVRAGCRPLLPNRLSYPELFPPEHLYDEEEFEDKLAEALVNKPRLTEEEADRLTERFGWQSLAPLYRKWLFEETVSANFSLSIFSGSAG